MTGCREGFVARVRATFPETAASHCVIHREALAVKQVPNQLKDVLDRVLKVVKFIKSRPLQARIFEIVCDEMGSYCCIPRCVGCLEDASSPEFSNCEKRF